MKKLIVLVYIAAATFLFGYAKAAELTYNASAYAVTEANKTTIDFPVHFEDLTVKLINNKAEINWSTRAEKNNKQFEIQRSTDGKRFKTIAIVFTLDDSNEAKHYAFKDELKGVKEKKLMYRIKQVDTSEGYTFSETVSPAL
ncbi:hypothetical protein [Agriterribacter sp.]|uniref:hypothetical protein n=1 Tax=Agriterribacter sp. TaxID=2821509 RepID=UPI002BBE3466|nr:hypothetical protein [Agriterribacter sp.]HTN05370.1 hypothetical protein [Agriterribacter sp.]